MHSKSGSEMQKYDYFETLKIQGTQLWQITIQFMSIVPYKKCIVFDIVFFQSWQISFGEQAKK